MLAFDADAGVVRLAQQAADNTAAVATYVSRLRNKRRKRAADTGTVVDLRTVRDTNG